MTVVSTLNIAAIDGNVPSTNFGNNLWWHQVFGDVRIEQIPHRILRTVLSQIQVVGAPYAWRITLLVLRKPATDDEHLRAVDNVTR